MAESEEEFKSLLMKVKESGKIWLKTQLSKIWDHGILSHCFMAEKRKKWKQWQILFSWVPKSLYMVTAAMKLPKKKKCLHLGRKAMTNLNSVLKSRDITLPTKYSQSYGFSSSHVWMWQLDHKEGWAQKNWCFWTLVLEKTLESPLDSKEIQHQSSKASVLQCLSFYIVQLLNAYMTTGKTIALTRQTFVGKLMSLLFNILLLLLLLSRFSRVQLCMTP